jgi:CHAD domain-containing protein
LAFQINHTIKSGNADSVHDVRVAIRRFTQSVAMFKSCFPGKEIRKIRRRLKVVMLAAGQVRDCDVVLKLLSKSRMPGGAQIQSKVRSQRKEAARILTSELKSWAERQMSLKWRAALGTALAKSEEDFGNASIEVTARRTLRRMIKSFYRHGREAAGSKATAEELHAFRIAAKKLRYSIELLEPVYGSALDPGLERLKQAQTLLGDINDCATMAGLVSHFGGGAPLITRLRKRQRKKTEEFRRYWAAEFRDGEQLRTWMDQLSRHGRIRKHMAGSATVSSRPNRKPVATARTNRIALSATAAI